ncbi:MAG TPA: aspartate/glutamate racemase family protein [Candidatus Methylomirabilis sp.]|nr:aspartate/glutamate racemase family protein [Candidatus Methylomirabilis sp.]
MRVILANPNATVAITDACATLGRAAAAPGTEIVPWTNRAGPPVVDGLGSDYLAGAALVRGLAAVAPRPDAIVLAGFGNYGTGAVKEVLDVLVVNMAEAAMAFAVPLCHRFAIVTTSPRMIAYTEDVVHAFGFAARCGAIRAVSLPAIDAPPLPDDAIVERLAAEAEQAHATSGADLVILGGARLSPYAAALRRRTTVTIIEPVACGVAMAEALARIGLRQSPVGKFASPSTPFAPTHDNAGL